MNLERKVYENRSQKISDFVMGIGVFIAINTVVGTALSLGASLLGGMMTYSASSPGAMTNLLLILAFAIPILLQLGGLIYFGLTRYWIAIGMLVGFALSLLLVLLLTAACFGMISAFSNR